MCRTGEASQSGAVDAPLLDPDGPRGSVQGPASAVDRRIEAAEHPKAGVQSGVGVVQGSAARVVAEDDGGASCCAASGQTLAALQGFIAAGSTGASDNQASEYTNANYSLTRVLIPQIAYGEGVISELAGMFPLDAVYAALYASYVTENVLEPAGIAATVCASDEAEDTRTLLYTSPTPNDPGLDPGDWSLSCGAAGWHLSAVQLLRLLAFVRFSEVVISAATRELMDDLYLGWLDPTAFAGYVQSTILPLVYRGHGGDFVGMTGCMMNYHITVQVSLVINSTGGDLGGHACALLRNAFDNAWVAN